MKNKKDKEIIELKALLEEYIDKLPFYIRIKGRIATVHYAICPYCKMEAEWHEQNIPHTKGCLHRRTKEALDWKPKPNAFKAPPVE